METKNSIKKRMIAQAASTWGMNSKEIERSDPVVPLLLDACASEIENISKSIAESRQKIGNRIMELLTPDELTSPYPARAITTANPVEAYCDIDENHEFSFSRKLSGGLPGQEVDLYFTPTCPVRLFKGEVRYLACHDVICKKNETHEIVEFCRAGTKALLDENQLWIGVNLSRQVQSLDTMSFYFDLQTSSGLEENLFYNALPDSQWDIGGKRLWFTGGLGDGDPQDLKFSLIASGRELSKPRAICYHVNNFYKKRFIVLAKDPPEPANIRELTGKYPLEFSQIFKEDKLKEMEGNLLWIHISFAQHIPFDILRKVNCSINCFPVINRRSEKVIITSKEKIVGLKAEKHEMYLGLKKIKTGDDITIVMDEARKNLSEKTIELELRKDNLGRFNSSNALEIIRQMVAVYREEFISFATFRNINQDSVENLRNAILPFETLLDELQDVPMDSMPYLTLRTLNDSDDYHAEVEYWLTNGALANRIAAEENLRYDSANLVRDKIFLMTSTMGGMDKKRNEQIAHDFQYAFLTRDRIVTKADIKSLCFKIFHDVLQKVTIREGVAPSTLPNTGLRRTIDIHLSLTGDARADDESVRFLKEELLTHLAEKSANLLPYRIFINQRQ